MDDKVKFGKQFEFDNSYWGKPKKYKFVDLLQAGELCCEGNFEMGEHLQICHEITYIISGEGTITTNGKSVKASEGNIYLTRKGQLHKIKAGKDSPLRYYYLAFNFNEGADAPEYKTLKDLFADENEIVAKDNHDVAAPFSKIMDELYYFCSFSNDMMESYISQIILLTYRSFTHKENARHLPLKSINSVGYTVYSVIRYINENIYEIHNVKDISEEMGYSDSYISRVFKEKMGMTLQAYVTLKKMEKAVEMIEVGHHNMTQIALRLNYEAVQSFSKSFKRTLGLSPMDYQREYRKSLNG